jgi:hypothetical protein
MLPNSVHLAASEGLRRGSVSLKISLLKIRIGLTFWTNFGPKIPTDEKSILERSSRMVIKRTEPEQRGRAENRRLLKHPE